MPSANGWKIEYQGHELVAAWAAPFYALIPAECPEDGDEPYLIHCDSFEHAASHRGIVLDKDFNRLDRESGEQLAA